MELSTAKEPATDPEVPWSAAVQDVQYQGYRTAVMTPGFSDAQRRLLYRAALRDLAADELFALMTGK